MAQNLTWGCVRWSARMAVVCGQGPSWADVDLGHLREVRSRIGHALAVIAVNGAIEQVPWADFFFTLDHSPENLARVADPVPGVRYVQAVPDDYAERDVELHDHVTYLRRIVREAPQDGRPFRERVREQIVGGLSDDRCEIHTGNSAFGALGLAYLMGAIRVVLLGVDGRGRERWDGTRNRYLGHLPELFAGAAGQLEDDGVQVVNGAPESAVDCFPRVPPGVALDWLLEADGHEPRHAGRFSPAAVART